MKYWFDIKASGDKPNATAVNFRVTAADWDGAVRQARIEAGRNFGEYAHRVWIIRGGEMEQAPDNVYCDEHGTLIDSESKGCEQCAAQCDDTGFQGDGNFTQRDIDEAGRYKL